MHTCTQISEGVGQRGFLQVTLRGGQSVATRVRGLSQLVHVHARVIVGVVLVQRVVGGPVSLHLLLDPQLLHSIGLGDIVVVIIIINIIHLTSKMLENVVKRSESV